MGFFSKLFGSGKSRGRLWVEHVGEPFEVPLYPIAGYQEEREALASGQYKWYWADLGIREQTRGEHKGENVITVTVNGLKVGEIPARLRNSGDYEAAFDFVYQGVNVATVCITRGGTAQGLYAADLTFGSHRFMPARPD